MKKALLLLASAALLLVGCAKEKFAEPSDGGLTNVTISACIDGGVATRALADNDGKGANVNRCIMEIYFQDQLYKRMEAAMSGTPATATFANVPVVAGKEYQILFWADCGDELADKYYTTKTEGEGNMGLKAVTVAKDAFIGALKAGENDKLDAFYAAQNYTVSQTGDNAFTIKLHRPFAQLNVITTDVAAGKTVINADLLPEKVSVSYTAATTFNVADSTVTGSATYAYEAPVYGEWSDTKSELTLSMDYILAAKDKGAIDVTFKTKNGADVVMSHSLANLPYQRNYRTNVKGELLTAGGTWTATVDPIWGTNGDGGEIDHIIASSYTEVVNALQSGNDSKNLKVTVTPAAVDLNKMSDAQKQDVIEPVTIDGENMQALKFVLYEKTAAHEASPEHVEFELPARPSGVAAWKIEYEPEYPTETVVVSTKEEDNANVIIEAPKSTVTLDATKVNSVVSTTSENTLIIPQGLELKNLTVKKGAVEYHGTGLEKVTIATEGQDNAYFKTSEGLANTDAVYGVVKDHIAEGYAITKESESTWKIVPEVCKIGAKSYGTLIDAVAAVQSGETITFVKDIENAAGIAIETGKNFTIDFAGHKYIVNKPGAGSTDTKTNAFQLLKGQTITFKNGTIEAAEDNLSLAVAPAKNIMRMFQSYANVNFEDMTIDCTNLYGAYAANEFACGTVSMTGNTSIFAKEGAKSINVDTWKDAYPEGAAVTINATGTIGDIYLYAEGTGEEYTKSSLTIKKGAFASITDDGSEDWTSAVSGGTFTADPTKYLAPKCEAVLGGDGLYYVNKVYDCTATIELPNGEVKEFNSGENNSGVMDAINYLDFKLYSEFPAADYPGYVPVIKMHKDDVVWNTHAKTSSPSKYGSCTYQQGYTSVLDGQGHTLTSKKNVPSGYKVNTTGLIKLMNNANVTIKNITLQASNADLYDIDVVNGSTATLENVVLCQSSSWAVVNNNSTIYYNNVTFPSSRTYDGTSSAVADIFVAGGPYKFNCKTTTTAKIGTSFMMSVESIGNRVDQANWETGAICYCTNDFVFHIASEIPETEEVTAAIPNTTYGKAISYCGDDGLKNLFKVMALSGSNYESITIYKTSTATKLLSNGKSIAVTFEGDAVYNNNFTAGSGYHIEASEPVSKTITYTSVAD